ncbi:MAG: phage tail tube protein [Pseudomonadota bacterium]
MPRARGARSILAGAFETNYGEAPASGFRQLPFATSGLSQDVPLLESELLGFGRDPLAPIPDVETTDGPIVIPIDAENLGLWLKATFGDPVTSGAGPYTHVFSSGGWELPSLALEVGMPDAPTFSMFEGVKVDSFRFQKQRGGQLQATVELIAQGETPNAATQAGSLTSYALKRFGQRQGTLTREGAAIGNIVSASFNYANNLDRIDTLRNDGKIEGIDEALAACTGEIVVRFANSALLNQAKAGTPSAFTYGFTNGTESVVFSVPKVYLPVPRRSIEGPGGIQATFAWQAAQDDAAAPMVTATLINSVESY